MSVASPAMPENYTQYVPSKGGRALTQSGITVPRGSNIMLRGVMAKEFAGRRIVMGTHDATRVAFRLATDADKRDTTFAVTTGRQTACSWFHANNIPCGRYGATFNDGWWIVDLTHTED